MEQLYRSWMDKSASEAELTELWTGLEGKSPEELGAMLQAQWQREDGRFDYPEARRKQALDRILERRRTRILPVGILWRAAAAIFVLAIAGYWLLHREQAPQKTGSLVADTSYLPGSNPAGVMLTLEDGSLVSLDSLQNGTVTLKGGTRVHINNGLLSYEGGGDELAYNTISTPKGRQYQIRLPDGTQVWLNAGSSIRYPVRFAKGERQVFVTGETYLSVATDAKAPFRVDVNGKINVDVLGTEFNINAYENEPHIRTTLINGKIRLAGGNRQVVLAPGQEAIAGDGQLVTRTADVQKVIAWKEGVFHFDGASFPEMMREVERWYDVEVVYEGVIPALEFQGEISRSMKLADLLATLQKFGIRSRLEGRRITIQP